MATVMEMIGLSPMNTASVPQVDPRKHQVAFRCGEVVMDAVKAGRKARDIATREAFENAIASVAATGGSTNAVLHLLAMAREAQVDLKIEDFQTISQRTPLLVDLKPGGKYVALDVDNAGGWPVVAKRMADGGYAHKNAMTVTGRTFGVERARSIAGRSSRSTLSVTRFCRDRSAVWLERCSMSGGARFSPTG